MDTWLDSAVSLEWGGREERSAFLGVLFRQVDSTVGGKTHFHAFCSVQKAEKTPI